MGETLNKAARYARQAALAGIRAAGGFAAVSRSAWRRNRLLILCYHGVSLQDEHEWNGNLFVSPAFLRRRFEILRDGGYSVLPLGESIRKLRNGTLPPRSVVLTFDDGFYNYLAAAVPLLEEFGFPATNYVSSYFCIHQRPVPYVTLRYLLWSGRLQELPAGVFPKQEQSVDLRDSEHRSHLAAILIDQLLALSGRETQHAFLEDVAAKLGVDFDHILRSRLFNLMTPSEIRDLARRGFDVQLHTHRHRTPRDRSAFCGEILENRRILEELTGHSATHFCYPSGDVDAMFLPWLRELGVETATIGEARFAEAGDEPLLLPRYVDTMAKPEILFESWLSGAGALLRRPGA